MNSIRSEPNYESEEEVAAYDTRMRLLRNVDAENEDMLSHLKLPAGGSVLEIGTGTGSFVRAAARKGFRASGIDISMPMLRFASARAKEEGADALFSHAGFLSFEAPEQSFDGIVSALALHHLPDVWKAVALRNIFRWLKPGGRFILEDVVFNWDSEVSPEVYFDKQLEARASSRANFARHIAKEYSTENWILEGLFVRAGFRIESNRPVNSFLRIISAVREA